MEFLFDWKEMYKITSRGLLLALFLFNGACATFTNYEVITAPVMSMTHSKLPKNYRLKIGQHFISKFCEGNKPIYDTGEMVGMADQALYLVQKKHKATHLLDVRISKEGDCMIVVGNLAKAYRVKRRRNRRRKISSSIDEFEFTNEILLPDISL